MKRRLDLIGRRFGELFVIADDKTTQHGSQPMESGLFVRRDDDGSWRKFDSGKPHEVLRSPSQKARK